MSPVATTWLLILCLSAVPQTNSYSSEELEINLQDASYGFIEHFASREDTDDDQPDLGESLIIHGDDNSKEERQVVQVRLKRDDNKELTDDSTDDEGSGEAIEEITLTPPPKVIIPKIGDTNKNLGKPVYPPHDDVTEENNATDTTTSRVTQEVTTETTKTHKTVTKPAGYGGEPVTQGDALEVQSASSVSWLPIFLAAVTSGILFFFIGFFVNKYKSNRDMQGSGYTMANGREGFSQPGVELQAVKSDRGARGEDVQVMLGPSTSDEHKTLLSQTGFSTFKANNTKQSPINIKAAKYEERLLQNVLSFQKEKKKFTLKNTGTTLKAEPDGESAVVSGGPLGRKRYLLDHFHFHWGSTDNQGSEHLLSDKAYAAEVHVVFSDTDISSFEEAVKSERSDSLAVVGVLIEAGSEHVKLKPFTDAMAGIEYKGDSAEVDDFDITSILPANLSEYWTYSGSLTTPPYSENVKWIVYRQPVQMSSQQLAAFRRLTSAEKTAEGSGEGRVENKPAISDNFRSTQSLEGRIVLATFR